MARIYKAKPKFDISPQPSEDEPKNSSSGDWDRRDEDNRKLASDWKTQIELAERRNDIWEKRCERIIKRFRDERTGTSTSGAELDVPRRMNILWSNVQTLKPSIYGREPLPVAERRFLDRDPIGRVASQILERALRYEMTESGFHDTVDQAVQDYLLVGRGTVWLRYKPLFGPATSLTDRGNDEIDPSGDEFTEPTTNDPVYDPEKHDAELSDSTAQEIQENLVGATVEVDYVHWKDFHTAKARFWKENEWVSRRIYMSRQDCIDTFGKEIGKEIPLEMTPEVEPGSLGNRTTRAIPEDAKKAIVHEIWFKPKRKVYFIAKGYEFLLEEPREDPLGSEGFWPCPKPLYATMTNDTLEPVPDYIEYQDQALEIDSLTNRIDSLIKALKVAGVYDSSQKNLARLLDEGHENQLIPIPNWAAFAEKGGINNAISFLPIKEIADVLSKLFEARDKIKNDLYEITGIADIMRGQADPRETAAAVNTKGKWGSLRLQQRQAEVARFCRDIVKMMGEVICDHYPDQTLIEVSGIMYDDGIGPEPPSPPAPSQTPVPLAGGMGQGGPPALPPSPVGSAPPTGMGGPGAVPGAGGPPGQGGLPAPIPPPNPLMAMLQFHQQMQAVQQAKMGIIQRAIGLLRSDKLRGFRIDIETDSTINDNAKEETQDRVQFMTALSGFVEKSMMAVKEYPEMLPLLGKSILFTVRGFRVGRDLESAIEEFVDKAEQDIKKTAGQPKPPSPEQIKANADMQMSQIGLQEAQLKMQADQTKSQAEVQAQQVQAQSEASNLQMKQRMQEIDFQIKQFEARVKMEEMQNKAASDAATNRAKLEEIRLGHAAKLREQDSSDMSREHEMRMKTQEHVQKMKEMHQKSDGGPKIEPYIPKEAERKTPEKPPMAGARKAKDGKWYVQHPESGQYFRIDERKEPTEIEKAQLQAIKEKSERETEQHRMMKERHEILKKRAERDGKPRKVVRDHTGKIVGIE